ncbi:sulfatase-like hydrolase/transferase [Paenibacillus sp. ATY16]|uniref:sulfatase family protein n=1 Tax=Paenibacillus sp. ATY16 TaxID=1759312 RepID=UPI00200D0CF5|nr:sulfatase-like hydrolase/transferase [Paenibacillus sp. ATY16]MCK9862151.1 sulfatase-like hydrolase/transferase [Paenibacillus sp. ATY16]
MKASIDKPNVLFIMDDQHRFDYLGSMGASFVRTPNLDRLAEKGVRFTNGFTNAPLCVPARIALATGLQPARLGLVDNSHVLDPQLPTLYQRFRDNGYRVHCVGKLDLNKSNHYNGRYGDRPDAYRWGFTHPEQCEGKAHAGSSRTPIGPYTNYLEELNLLQSFYEDYRNRDKKQSYENWYRDSALPTEAFEDCYIGRRAAEWIETVPDDYPWFSFVSFVGPHAPFDPPTQYADRYRFEPMPPAAFDSAVESSKPEWIRRRQEKNITEEQITASRRQYCAAVEVIDDQIGLILDALKKRGMEDNTYIIFTSDHGEMLGDHRLYNKNLPYEPSIHIPLLAAGPGIQGGRVSDALIELIDLNPTVSDLAGLSTPKGLDAISFSGLLKGETNEHRSFIMSTGKQFQCLRDKQFKLIQHVNGLIELFDLENDPQEFCNVASVHHERTAKMVAQLKLRLQAAQSGNEEVEVNSEREETEHIIHHER